jgi:4-hydroxy-tetrahydrodipicolinate synthase
MANFSREQLRTSLAGPAFPLLVPFGADGESVDHPALDRYVRFLVAHGAPVILTTVGTSRFNLLSADEIKAVNETVVGASSKSCMTIAAGPQIGSTSVNVEFARHAERIGADAYIAFYPDRHYGDAPILEFYRALSDAVDIGIFIHEMPIRSGFYGTPAHYGLDLLDALLSLPGVVGMKEECMDGGYAYKIHRRFADRCAIIGAGSMRNYMRDYHAGAKSYLVGVGSFFPRVAIAFHAAMSTGDFQRAHAIVRQYEEPIFDVAVSLGWHVALKEILHLLDLMPPFERAPLTRLGEAERRRLSECMDKLGWIGVDAGEVSA